MISWFLLIVIFLLSALFLFILCIAVIIKAFQGGSSDSRQQLSGRNTQLLRELLDGLDKMEGRLESLETIILDSQEHSRADR